MLRKLRRGCGGLPQVSQALLQESVKPAGPGGLSIADALAPEAAAIRVAETIEVPGQMLSSVAQASAGKDAGTPQRAIVSCDPNALQA